MLGTTLKGPRQGFPSFSLEPKWGTPSSSHLSYGEKARATMDITERKRAEEALRQSEANLRQQAQELEQ